MLTRDTLVTNAAAATAEVATIRLFKGAGCQTTDPLTLSGACVSSMKDLQHGEIGSCIVDAGTWLLYKGDNFSHGALILGPGTYDDLSDGKSLCSLRPLPPASDATLVLFQDTNFCGQSIVLSRDCEDLSSARSRIDLCKEAATSFGVSSAIVVSGKWSLFTAANAGGDSQTVFHRDTSNYPPGTYPTLQHNDSTRSAYVSREDLTDGWAWMTTIPDATSLALLTIPGTHDSGAIRGNLPIVDQISQCQSMNAMQQLITGIRFFDLRLNRDLEVQHGSGILSRDEGTSLGDWCENLAYFLSQNTKECVILSIDCEGDVPPDFVSSITSTFTAKNLLYFSDSTIPTLQEVRGKAVILRRFAYDGDFGWDCSTGWSHGDSFTLKLSSSDVIRGQDNYDLAAMAYPPMDTKWGLITAMIDEASGNTDGHTLYINFLSGAGDGGSAGLPWPVTVALGKMSPSEGMNHRLLDLLTGPNPPAGPLGILVMDFPDKPAKLLHAIIALNHVTP